MIDLSYGCNGIFLAYICKCVSSGITPAKTHNQLAGIVTGGAPVFSRLQRTEQPQKSTLITKPAGQLKHLTITLRTTPISTT